MQEHWTGTMTRRYFMHYIFPRALLVGYSTTAHLHQRRENRRCTPRAGAYHPRPTPEDEQALIAQSPSLLDHPRRAASVADHTYLSKKEEILHLHPLPFHSFLYFRDVVEDYSLKSSLFRTLPFPFLRRSRAVTRFSSPNHLGGTLFVRLQKPFRRIRALPFFSLSQA